MDALVGYGTSSSDSEAEGDFERSGRTDETKGSRQTVDAHKRGSVNLLTASPNNSSDDEQENSSNNEEYVKACEYLQSKSNAPSKLPNPLAGEKLPAPNLDKRVDSTFNTKEKQSVFVTSYQKDEEAKLSILEKHVKVTALPTGAKINGKQVCWLYRKGQCKKGHRCKFAHDNDLFVQNDPNTDSQIHGASSSVIGTQSNRNIRFGEGYFATQHVTREVVDEDSYMSNMKRKPRPGINDHLRPCKKSMTMLEKQRAAERPWTIQKPNT